MKACHFGRTIFTLRWQGPPLTHPASTAFPLTGSLNWDNSTSFEKGESVPKLPDLDSVTMKQERILRIWLLIVLMTQPHSSGIDVEQFTNPVGKYVTL